MKVPTLAATAFAAAVSAQNSTFTTSPPTSSSAAPSNSNYITTSVLWAADGPIQSIPGVDLPTEVVALQGSIVTVNPSGTVVKVACPYTTSSGSVASSACSMLNDLSYTLRPNYEANHIDFALQTRIAGVQASLGGILDSVCTSTNTNSLTCSVTMTARASAQGTKTESVTSTTLSYSDPTYAPLIITGGLDKTAPIPKATGAAGSLKAGTFFGAAGAIAAAALAL